MTMALLPKQLVIAGAIGSQNLCILLFLLFTAFSPLAVEAIEPPPVLWDRSYGEGYIYSVDETFDGGVVATGYWWPQTIMLLRTDADGDTLWTRSILPGWAYSVLETSDHGYVIGGTRSPVSFLTLLIRTDQNGDTLWTRSYGAGEIHSVLELENGDFILCGSNGDVILGRVDSFGNALWFKSYGIPNGDVGYAVDQTDDGGFIVGGSTRRGCNCSTDGWILRMDANGDTLWTRQLNGALNTHDVVYSIKETEDGGFIFTGRVDMGGPWVGRMNSSGDTLWTRRYSGGTGHEITPVSEGGHALCIGSGSLDLGVLRLDTAGDTLWTLKLGGPEMPPFGDFDEGFAIRQMTDGGFIIGGNRDCPIDEGGGCSPPHAWLVRLGPESTASVPRHDPVGLVAFPNPFRTRTTLTFDLPVPGAYRLAVFDVQGRSIVTLAEEFLGAGRHQLEWDGRDTKGIHVDAGVYFIRLSGPVESRPAKLVFNP